MECTFTAPSPVKDVTYHLLYRRFGVRLVPRLGSQAKGPNLSSSSQLWIEETWTLLSFTSLPQKMPQCLYLCPHRFLMRVLDSYGDDYRDSQFTIVLEVSSGLQAGWENGGIQESLTTTILHLTRMMAAKALMSLPQAMLRMNLQRKRDFPHHKGQLQP